MKQGILFLLFFSPFFLKAQHENHYQEIGPISTDVYELSFETPHSQKGFVFVKMTIENKTRDYLMFEPHKSSFKFDAGSFSPEEETIIIPPKEDETYRFKVTGEADFHVNSMQFGLDGLSRFDREGDVQEADPFKLPASKNTFKVDDGIFECSLAGDVTKETDVTKAAFECTYYGEGVGLVDQRKVSVKTEDGDEFANKKKKGLLGKVSGKKATKTLLDGESTTIKTQFEIPAKVVDMQFAPLFIHWNEAFRESIPEKLEGHDLHLELDKAKTEGMN